MNDASDQNRSQSDPGTPQSGIATAGAPSLGNELHQRYGVDPGVARTLSGFGLGETMLSFAQGRASLAAEIGSRWSGRDRAASGAAMQHSRLWSATTRPIAKSTVDGQPLPKTIPGMQRSAALTSENAISSPRDSPKSLLPPIAPEPGSEPPSRNTGPKPGHPSSETGTGQAPQQFNVAASRSQKIHPSRVETAAPDADAVAALPPSPVRPSHTQRVPYAGSVSAPASVDSSTPTVLPAPHSTPGVPTPHVPSSFRIATGTPSRARTAPFSETGTIETAHTSARSLQPPTQRSQSEKLLTGSAVPLQTQGATADAPSTGVTPERHSTERNFETTATLAPTFASPAQVPTPSQSTFAKSHSGVHSKAPLPHASTDSAATEVGSTNTSMKLHAPQPILPAPATEAGATDLSGGPQTPQPMLLASAAQIGTMNPSVMPQAQQSIQSAQPPSTSVPPRRGQSATQEDTPLRSPGLPSAHIAPSASRQVALQRPVLSRAARLAATLQRQQHPIAATRSEDTVTPGPANRQLLPAERASVAHPSRATLETSPVHRTSADVQGRSILPASPSATSLIHSRSIPPPQLSRPRTPQSSTALLPASGSTLAVPDSTHRSSPSASAAEDSREHRLSPSISAPATPSRPAVGTSADLLRTPSLTVPAPPLISRDTSRARDTSSNVLPLEAERPQTRSLQAATENASNLGKTPQTLPAPSLGSVPSATHLSESSTTPSSITLHRLPAGIVAPAPDGTDPAEQDTRTRIPSLQPATDPIPAAGAALQRTTFPALHSPVVAALPLALPATRSVEGSRTSGAEQSFPTSSTALATAENFLGETPRASQGPHQADAAPPSPFVARTAMTPAHAASPTLAELQRATATFSPAIAASARASSSVAFPAVASTTASQTVAFPAIIKLQDSDQPLADKPASSAIQSAARATVRSPVATVHRRFEPSAHSSLALAYSSPAASFSGATRNPGVPSQTSAIALERSPASTTSGPPLAAANSDASAPIAMPPSAAATAQASAVNLPQLADQVYTLLVRRLASERQRKGA